MIVVWGCHALSFCPVIMLRPPVSRLPPPASSSRPAPPDTLRAPDYLKKMYGYLVKIADELKTLRAESEQLICASEYSQKAWHEGGMWRGPNVLPGASASSKPGLDASRKPSTLDGGSNNIHGNDGGGNGNGGGGRGGGAANNPCSGGPALVPRVPVSLTDLFLDIVSEFICRFVVIFPRSTPSNAP